MRILYHTKGDKLKSVAEICDFTYDDVDHRVYIAFCGFLSSMVMLNVSPIDYNIILDILFKEGIADISRWDCVEDS